MTNNQIPQNPAISQWDYDLLLPFRLVAAQTPHNARVKLASLEEHLCGPGQLWEKSTVLPSTHEWPQQAHQAYAYFHPFVRRFLFNEKKCLHLKRRDIDEDTTLSIKPVKGSAETTHLQIRGLSLTFFEGSDVGLLALRLTLPEGNTVPWDVALQVRDQLRRIYPPYIEEEYVESKKTGQLLFGRIPLEIHCAELHLNWPPDLAETDQCTSAASPTNGSPTKYQAAINAVLDGSSKHREQQRQGETPPVNFYYFPHWQTLLAPLVTDTTAMGTNPNKCPWQAVQLGDDRAQTLEWIGFDIQNGRSLDEPWRREQSVQRQGAGWPHRGQWVRLCFVDAMGTDRYTFSSDFLKNFEVQFTYDRFWFRTEDSADAPSRILNCGYAFTFAGNANDNCFFNNAHDGARFIARYCYFPMGLIAHFQKAALLTMSARITELQGPSQSHHDQQHAQKLRALYEDFLNFTKDYWHEEISPQEQGRELFEQWQKQLRTPQLYAEVRQELNDLMTALNTAENHAQSTKVTWLTHVAAWIGGASLGFAALSLLAALVGIDNFESALNPGQKWELGSAHTFPALLLAVSLCLIAYAIKKFFTFKKVLKTGDQKS